MNQENMKVYAQINELLVHWSSSQTPPELTPPESSLPSYLLLFFLLMWLRRVCCHLHVWFSEAIFNYLQVICTWTISITVLHTNLIFCSLTSFSIIICSCIHLVDNARISFVFCGRVPFHDVFVSIVLIKSSANGHLGCFCNLAIVQWAAVSIGVEVALLCCLHFHWICFQEWDAWLIV